MLEEQTCRQIPDEPPRRWFADDYFDLIVWGGSDQGVTGFQLCYDKPGRERALTWLAAGGFSHAAVDDGESAASANCTPVLVADGCFPAEEVSREFLKRSGGMESWLRDWVSEKIRAFPQNL
ncbi:MAG: hypothetical protein P4M10_07715 [Verrucomicrobiae bacterium]|nr:hypothetical protein [Verrucomicrobiae bacterium]